MFSKLFAFWGVQTVKQTVVFVFFVVPMAVTPFYGVAAQEIAPPPAVVSPETATVQEEVITPEAPTEVPSVSEPVINDPSSDEVVPEQKDQPKPEEKDKLKPEDKFKDPKAEEEAARTAAATGFVGPLGIMADQSDTKVNRLSTGIDNLNGSFVYEYDIVVPPGRNGMTPDVALRYNSSDATRDSFVGAGWSVNIPYIERINKKGSDKLYTENYFVSSIDGELVSTGSGTYAAQVENGNFLSYTLSSNIWTVIDKGGTVYKFGNTAAARQDKASDTSKVYKWMLEEVRDTNDNYIKYEYYKDAGQIYPSRIVYTGNGSTDGILEVNFERESRSNAPTFFNTGFSVVTNYRISEIRTEVNNVWARKYALAYASADNGSSTLLNTVTESGQDDSSNITTLPAVDFNYNTAATDWTYNSNWDLPVSFIHNGADYGLRIADFNGDGLQDLLCANEKNSSTIACNKNNPDIFMNNGSGWTNVDSTWSFPYKVNSPTNKEAFTDGNYLDTGLRTADVNGDQKVDLVKGFNGASYTYINNGSGWTYDSTWDVPLPFVNTGAVDTGVRMADINGDGLPDLMCHNDVSSGGICPRNNPEIYINNGAGWTNADATWSFPAQANDPTSTEYFLTSSGGDRGLRIMDVNVDSLADLVRSNGSAQYIYINNGSGWTYDSNWSIPMNMLGSTDTGVRVSDINGDSLPDFLCHNDVSSGSICPRTDPEIYRHNGNGWTNADSTWVFPSMVDSPSNTEYTINGTADNGRRFHDLNGDQLDDIVRSYNGTSYVYLNNEDVPANFLTQIIHGEGGNTSVTYKSTSQLRDGSNNLLNPNLPVPIHIVTQISESDGAGLTATQAYSYEGGRYYFNTATERKFAGFNKVITTDSASNQVVQYFHQGNTTDSSNGEYDDHVSKIGKSYRTEIKDSSGNIYSKSITKWDKYQIAADRHLVKMVQNIEMSYDGDSDHKDKAATYTYSDTNGNLTESIDWGEVTGSDNGTFSDTGNDKFTTSLSYASNTGANIIGLPSQETTLNQSSSKVRETKYYYDTQTLGSVTDGNLTKQESWKDGSNYIDIEKTYNTIYGIVTQEKDPRDKTTSYSYDSYNLYPTTITNALSQITTITYDYTSGKPKQATDTNSRVFQTVYDGLDRVKEEKQPDISSPSSLVTKTTYVYTDTSGSVSVQKTDHLDGSTSVDSYSYFDGLGRAIQSRTEMETSNNYAVTDTIYNNVGKVHKQSIPYTSTGSAKTSATGTSSLLITNSYDAMGRVTSIANTIGTTSTAYDDWKTTITDPRSKNKELYNDARGNLIRVDEHNGASTYSTYYEYDGNNNLTKLTDALGNVRNFTYDGLGRRLTAQDLHAVADATFGTWTYSYDASGNLTSVVDPKSQTINYTYDDLNRMSTEDYTGQAGTEATYSYDSGTDGIGRLTSVTATGASTSNSYDALGNLRQEVKTINSNSYQTEYTYDRHGNRLEIINPDSSRVKYTYNTAGQLETIQRKESTDAGYINVVTNYNYGPHGQITSQSFQNGATTTNTYDSAKLYRLSNRTTTITGGSKAQDLTYTYDNNSNITRIVDVSNTNSSKTVDYTYDDLNRLLSATATAVASGQSTYTHSYTYDAIGNILTRTDSAGTYSYTGNTGVSYANPHAVTSVGLTAYVYDNNGNLLSETGGLTNTWDYNNRLTQAVKGAVVSNYTYDYDGQRVKLSNGTVTNYYPTGFYNTDGTTSVKHITTPGGQSVATVKGTGTSATVFSTHTDHLSGSNAITNSGGTLEELMDYYPYGNIRIDQKAGSFDEQRKYIGEEYDADTGLNYLNARYYHAGIGRFVSQDSVFWRVTEGLSDPQLLSAYSYSRNNPLVYIDPNGDWPTRAEIYSTLKNSSRYNPMDYLYGSSSNKIANGLYDGNYKQAAEGAVEATVTTILVVDTALTVGTGGGALYTHRQNISASKLVGPPTPLQKPIQTPVHTNLIPQPAKPLGLPSAATHKTGTCFCTLSNEYASKITTPGAHGYKHRSDHFGWLDESGYQLHIKNVIAHPSEMKYLKNNRMSFYDNDTNTLVIINRNYPGQSTAFRPGRGKDYVDDLDANR